MSRQKETIDKLNAESWEVMLADSRKAAQIAGRALTLARKAQYDIGTAEALLNRGLCEVYLAKYDTGLATLSEAKELYKRLEDNLGLMKTLNAVGIVYSSLGEYVEASAYYEDSLALARREKNVEREIAALNNLGEIRAEMGRTADAIDYFREALVLPAESGSVEQTAHLHGNLGPAYRRQGRLEEAEAHLGQALTLSEQADDAHAYAEWLTELGLIAEDLGDFDTAEARHRDSITRSRRAENKPVLVKALQNLAGLLKARGRSDEALELFQEAVREGEAIKAGQSVAGAYKAISVLLEAGGDVSGALRSERRLAEIRLRANAELATMRQRTLAVSHEIEQAKREAEIYRLRNVDLKAKTDELDAAYNRMQVISQIGLEIARVLDIDVLLESIYKHINRLMDASTFGIALLSADGQNLRYELFIEEGRRISPFDVELEPVTTFGSWVVVNRKEVVIQDVESEYAQYVPSRARRKNTRDTQSLVFYPLSFGDRITGVVSVQSAHKHAYTEETVEVLRILSSYISIAIDNSLAHEELQRANEKISYLANHDNLTGLPNRRLLGELMNDLIGSSQRNNQGFGVYYLDLDDFKPINDELGHQAGDGVLVEVAKRLRASLRRSDVISRLGGDEFVALARQSRSHDELESVAEKIIECLSRPIRVGRKRCTLSASIGVAVYPEDDTTIEGLLQKADVAMYATKAAGKGRVVYYSDIEHKRVDQA